MTSFFDLLYSHIYVLDFTPDESFLLSGSADETVKIWSLESLHDFEDSDNVTLPSLGPAFDHKFLEDNVSFIVATDETNSLRVRISITKYLFFENLEQKALYFSGFEGWFSPSSFSPRIQFNHLCKHV